jgi:histidyl-tRNA synthetase
MGDVVIGLVLDKYGKVPALRAAPARALVTIFSPELALDSIRTAMRLRADGIDIELYPEPSKMAKQFRYADQLGIPFAIVVGPDEARENKIALKDLASGEQVLLPIDEASDRLR